VEVKHHWVRCHWNAKASSALTRNTDLTSSISRWDRLTHYACICKNSMHREGDAYNYIHF